MKTFQVLENSLLNEQVVQEWLKYVCAVNDQALSLSVAHGLKEKLHLNNKSSQFIQVFGLKFATNLSYIVRLLFVFKNVFLPRPQKLFHFDIP